MTEPTDPQAEEKQEPVSRKLVISAPVTAKPKFLTPALRAQMEEEARLLAEQQAAAASEEQAGLPSEEAVTAEIPVPAPVTEEPVAAPVIEPEPFVEPALAETAAEEQAGEASEQAAASGMPLPESAASPPQYVGLDPKIMGALAKIKEAQEELERAQQEAMATAMASVPIEMPPAQEQQQPVETTASTEQPTETVSSGPRFNIPGATPAAAPATAASAQAAPLRLTPKLAAPQATSAAQQPAAPTLQPRLAVPSAAPAATPAPAPVQMAAPSSIKPAGMAVPPAPTAQQTAPTGPVRPGITSSYGVKPPESLIKSKKYITMVSIFGSLFLVIAGITGYVYFQNQKKQKEFDHITELSKLGGLLNEKAYSLVGTKEAPKLKYDHAEYKVDVNPNMEDAKILTDYVRKEGAEKASWQSPLHLLAIMASLQPDIADYVMSDIRHHPKEYADKKISAFVTLLAVQENPLMRPKLFALADSLSKGYPAKQAIVVSDMRYCMDVIDLPKITALVTSSETNDAVRKAAFTNMEYMIQKISDKDKEALASEFIKVMDSIEPKYKATSLRLLSQTGSDKALEYLKAKFTNDPSQCRVLLDALSEWPNDRIYPVMMEFADSGKITNPDVIKSIKNTVLYQLSYERERTDEEAMKMFQPFVDAAEKEQGDEKQKSKNRIIKVLENLRPHGYVKQLLGMYQKDPDPAVAQMAKATMDRINTREEERTKPKQTRQEQHSAIEEMMNSVTAPN